MGKKRAETWAEIKRTYCVHNFGVDCEQHDQCDKCGFNPDVHAQRVKEIRAGMMPLLIKKAETAIIMERIRKKNQSR